MKSTYLVRTEVQCLKSLFQEWEWLLNKLNQKSELSVYPLHLQTQETLLIGSVSNETVSSTSNQVSDQSPLIATSKVSQRNTTVQEWPQWTNQPSKPSWIIQETTLSSYSSLQDVKQDSQPMISSHSVMLSLSTQEMKNLPKCSSKCQLKKLRIMFSKWRMNI